MAIIKWDPFFGLDELLSESGLRKLGSDGAVDIYEENNNIIVKMSIPGIDPDKFEITAEDDMLRVAGTREKTEEVEEKNYYRKEIRSGSFERVIHLPASVQSDKTTASYENGILMISLPKRAASGSKQVKVKVK
jgi:HSP20 family protein